MLFWTFSPSLWAISLFALPLSNRKVRLNCRRAFLTPTPIVFFTARRYTENSELLWESNTLLGPEVAGCPASHNLVLVSGACWAKVLRPAAPEDSGRAESCQMGWQLHARATNKKEAAQKWVSECIRCSEVLINLRQAAGTEQWERITALINVFINTGVMHTRADGYLSTMSCILIRKCHLFSQTTNYTHLVRTFN